VTATTQDVSARDAEELVRRARSQTRVRRELLVQLVRKDLKVKYQGSTLGFAWSLANPLFLLAVYSFVFQIVLKTGVPSFPVYLMSGLLVWNLFSAGVLGAAGSVVGNAGLVKKVRFPLSVLPFAAVGFALVHFVLQLGVLFVALVVFQYDFWGPQLLLMIPALAVAVLFTTALGWLVSALNVRYRDTYHVLELAMLAWFWLTPTVYAAGLVAKLLGPHGLYRAFFLDPMAIVAATMQRAIYKADAVTPAGQRVLADGGYAWYLEMLGIAAVVSLLLLLLARRTFRRMSADFAEEL
jgi:ABC-2 type transport system permease protein